MEADSVNPAQTPRFAASELGRHCLFMSLKHVSGLRRISKRSNSGCIEEMAANTVELQWLEH